MSNQSTIEHIFAICEEYKSAVGRHSMLLSMQSGSGMSPGEEIVKRQQQAINHFEDEAFVAVSRIKAFLDQDTLKIMEHKLTLEEICMMI